MKHREVTSCMLLTLVALGCAGDMDDENAEDAAVIEEPASVAPADTENGAAAMVAVDTLEGVGAYLTDAQGRSLYLLEGEPENESRCYDACAAEWPPFLAEGEPPTGANVQGLQAEFGTLERTDGSTQVTYGGHPLYYYHDDIEPGQTTGHDVTDQWGEWYLVTPAGEPVEESAAQNGAAENGGN